MKVTWKPRTGVTGTPVVLGDNTATAARGAGSRKVVSYRPGFEFATQAAAYAQAGAIETFGRGNLATGVTLVVDYEFLSYGDCTKFLTGLGGSLRFDDANSGVLEVRHTGGGADTIECCVQSAAPLQQVGCAATIQYNFIGGAFTRGTGNNLP